MIELHHFCKFLPLAVAVVPQDDEHKVKHLSTPTDILVDKITVNDRLVSLQPIFDRFDCAPACLVLR